MANRKVTVVRSVKISGQWKFINPNTAQKLKIPNDEGRWYICWRTGNKKEWQRADSWTHAMSLKLKKEAELHAISAVVALPTPNPARLTIADAVTQFKEDLTMLDRKDQEQRPRAIQGIVQSRFPPGV